MAKRVCPTPGCPTLIGPDQRTCADCARARDKARGTRQDRGYDANYDRERKRWKRILDSQPWPCWRCRQLIFPGFPWHLGHSDDRTVIQGPECPSCNLSAAGKASHR